MTTNWNDFRKAQVEKEEKADEGVCVTTAPLFLDLIEQDWYVRRELGGEMSKILQAALNKDHGFNSKSHSATARHVTAMNAVLAELTRRGHFKINGMVYTVAPRVEKPEPAPAPKPGNPAANK